MNTPSVYERAEPLPSSVRYLQHTDELLPLAAELRAQAQVALDTEFMREDTFHPLLALIQIGYADQIVLIDPVPLAGSAELTRLIAELPTVVLHSPGEDYGVLRQCVGALPAHTLDTQIAAPFAGLPPNLGLRELLRQVLDITLDKDQTRSNWLKRPLSAQQLSYAADDVRHLLRLQVALDKRIAERGRSAWFVDECRRLRQLALTDTPDAQPHWQFRRAEELPPAAQRRLYHLLHWRERRAREIDKPRNWIGPPALLWVLAERAPEQASEIETLMAGLNITGGKRRAESLLSVLRDIDPALDAQFIPAPAAFSGALKRRYSALRQAAETRARDLDLPADLLAPRRLLEPWLRESRIPAAWAGWREEALAGVLDGLPD